MVELHIKIRKRIARLAYGENFVSYNEGYKIIFDFDKEWDSIENKTARFIFGENYIDYPFNGNEVEIPLIKNADTLEIGVYSNNLYTTTPVKFKVLKSIKDEEKIEILVPEIYPEIEKLDDEDLIKVYDKSEKKIGISPLKKLFDRMKVAIDEALTAAKASGEFDGADGITPTIGDNGNWYLGDTDTGKPSRGADGKSAYSYAQDGGYTGTEAEFAAKLAEETDTVPENVALLEDVTVDEASGDFIPLLSQNGTEYRLSIGNEGVPVIKNANGETVWSGTSGGSSGGDTGGDDPGGGGTDTTWTSGVPYTLTIIADEYVNKTSGAFEAYAGWSRTDYTPCAGAARIAHTGNGHSSSYCAWCDINKNFISSFGISVSSAIIPEEIEVPADAAFFTMSTTSESMNAITVTPYGT